MSTIAHAKHIGDDPERSADRASARRTRERAVEEQAERIAEERRERHVGEAGTCVDHDVAVRANEERKAVDVVRQTRERRQRASALTVSTQGDKARRLMESARTGRERGKRRQRTPSKRRHRHPQVPGQRELAPNVDVHQCGGDHSAAATATTATPVKSGRTSTGCDARFQCQPST